eukprot:TRINITY_DN5134_c0_g1_i1.p1 TRINITY_DN5134_c0_g1~~TRINITY_DN5134_c0_g1_i1.p1  ORF type:complete len:184 (+),score=69.72 TRINITY_DN5134_c0_g1_i1:31-552(+)
MSHAYTIRGILVLDSEGKRLAAKYYTPNYSTVKDQLEFEKSLFNKTHLANSEIILFDNNVVVYRSSGDVFFYVIGSYDENELLLSSILNIFYDVLSILLRNQLDKRTVLENLDFVLLSIDELVDGGIILETEPEVIASRVSMRSTDDTPVAEQTLSQVFASARDQFTRSFLSN